MKNTIEKNNLTKVCFVGSARHTKPLDATNEKKFRSLKNLGELFIIGFSKNLFPQQFKEHAHFYLLPQLPFPILRYIEIFTISPIVALWLIFRHDIQVLVAQSPYEGIAAAWAKIIAGLLGRKVVLVLESHGNFEEDLFSQRKIKFPKLYRFVMNIIASLSVNNADLFRCISSSTKKQLEQWVNHKQIFQFPTWTDIDTFFEIGNHKDKQESQNIVYTGVLIPRKGVHHLVNAFAVISEDFPQARLIIVGKEDDKTYSDNLKLQINKLNLGLRTNFVPHITQKELAEVMGKACVFVLPSVSEGLGRVVVEAMATSTPVIGTNVGGIPDMVQDGVNGFLIQSGDEAELGQKMRWILDNPEQSDEMGRKAHAFAKNFFSVQAYIEGYRKIFLHASSLLSAASKKY